MSWRVRLVGLAGAVAYGCTSGPTAPSSASAACIPQPASANSVLPIFGRPFDGAFPIGNFFDHDKPIDGDANGYVLTLCGTRDSKQVDGHTGYDWRMAEGTPLLAVAGGVVLTAGLEPPHFCPELNRTVQALRVQLLHTAPTGVLYVSVYGHLSRIDVQEGAPISEGTVIGLSGNTGCSGTPHLHFGVARNIDGNVDGNWVLIDPYGWHAPTSDPWALDPRGAASVWLWKDGAAISSIVAPMASVDTRILQLLEPPEPIADAVQLASLRRSPRFANTTERFCGFGDRSIPVRIIGLSSRPLRTVFQVTSESGRAVIQSRPSQASSNFKSRPARSTWSRRQTWCARSVQFARRTGNSPKSRNEDRGAAIVKGSLMVVSVNGAELFYATCGTGYPCIVPCILGTEVYERLTPRPLTDHFNFVYVDLRGGGRSTGDPADLTFEVLASDLDDVRADLGVSRVAVLGYSILGVVALEYARRSPGTVSHVTTAGTPPAGDLEELVKASIAFFAADGSPERKMILQENMANLPPNTPPTQAVFARTPMRFFDPRFDAVSLFAKSQFNARLFEHVLQLTGQWKVLTEVEHCACQSCSHTDGMITRSLYDVERGRRETTKRDAALVRAEWPPDLLRGTSAIRRGRARLDGAIRGCNATMSATDLLGRRHGGPNISEIRRTESCLPLDGWCRYSRHDPQADV